MRGRGLRKRIVWATSLQLLLVSGAVGGLAYFSGQRSGFGLADNGPGFQAPQTALAPLETSKANGSGLGLFVVQTTMENHRGSLAIGRSNLGGAEVRLIFPAAPALPITQ